MIVSIVVIGMVVRMVVIVTVRLVIMDIVIMMDGILVMPGIVCLRLAGVDALVAMGLVFIGLGGLCGILSAFSTTSLWTRSPWPRRRALRWRERPRWRLEERFSLSSSASRWARSSASISA